jgi:tetratricopeptide (TPR) repeat protein
MKRILTATFVISLAGLVFLLPTAGFAQSSAKQATSPAAETAQGEEESSYTEEEYEAYEKSTQEPDLDKRVEMLNAFLAKYPESKLMSYITTAYEQLMYEYYNTEKWDKLEPAAEKWLKTHADNQQAMGYIATAAQKLGNNQKFLDYALKIYEKTPDAGLAYGISEAYNKLKDQAKYLEWTEKLFSYPEYNGEFQLRMLFVNKYLKANDYGKAADYAQKALTSLAEAKKPDSVSTADWNKQLRSVRRACYYTRGINYYQNKQNYQTAIKEFQNALNVEKFSGAYYYMGYCYWKMDQIEEAIDAFAKAYVLGGDLAPQAKEQLEKLYKGLHNNTTIGIDKVYKRAQLELEK